MPDDQGSDETFRSDQGRIIGWTGTILPVVLGVLLLVQDPGLGTTRLLAGLSLFALLAWAYLIRPRIELDGSVIRLVNAFRDVAVPAGLVDEVIVRTYVVLEVGGNKHSGVSVGHPTRALVRGSDRARGLVAEPGAVPVIENYAVYVEERLRQLVAAAHREAAEPGPVEKAWARAPLALAVALAAALLVLLLL
jgi:hypothetical protein